mmetsp:Transcript_43531/g.94847  ORF Transcript_43531/g.94847 Transcript_43531/m.94847 type:complete len:112 (-) Transcript_43531:26-361(-)
MDTVHESEVEPPHVVARRTLTAAMQKRVRVEVQDGRVFVGCLECVDYLRNLAVSDAFEVGVRKDDGTLQTRRPISIGVLMIPPEQLKKIEAGGPSKAIRYQPPDSQHSPVV